MSKIKIVFVPPTYEEIQHEVTRFDDENVPLETSFHTDISLLLRIDSLKCSAATIQRFAESIKPQLAAAEGERFDAAIGKLSDDELIQSCPSRYVQSLSEQKSVLESLAAQHKEDSEKAALAAKEKEEKDKLAKDEEEFQSKMRNLLSQI